MHWAVKAKEARVWRNLVHRECHRRGIANLKHAKAELILTRYSSSELDFDNLASSFKYILDGLVQAGVITDDKPSVIGSPTFIWQKCPPKQGKISIKILV